ncbi:ABC transporter substrate-binding protein [Paenibacillus sp. CF384]|uniref:ABC transporter substrate-binding protein n=1 Tax=Paenibacillus sp. CF384 TaxID=1884382 RepID=UPI00089D4175|nr:extracellular solute-binding protein [Paenibacillus sp. CF384]SDW66274.1 carbohydrate ABC transporter substrate-binding protein, CUT1 family [Paenibacillus sp. CF384]
MKRKAKSAITTGCVSLALMTAITACSSGGGNGGNANAGEQPPAQTKDGKTVVTVSVLENDRFLQTAEANFEKAHPDIDIQITAAIATPEMGKKVVRRAGGQDENSADKEKFVSTVNTELMSGKGADLIAVQDLPFNKYAEKGLLTDLRSVMKDDKDFNLQDYYEGIMDGVTVEGKQAALPIRFSLDVLLANTEELAGAGITVDDSMWTWKDFTDIAHKLVKDEDGDGKPDKYTMSGMSKDQMLRLMVESSYEHYVDAAAKKASFDQGDFAAMLENLKGLYDDGLVSDGMPAPGQQSFGHMNLMMPMDLVMLPEMMFQGKGQVFQTPSGGEAKGMTYDSDLMLALNEKSGAKKEAWAFMKYLLSAEAQGTPGIMGFSVRKDMTAKQVQESMKMLESGKIKIAGPEGEISPPTVTEEDVKAIVNTIPRIKRFSGDDSAIMDMVKEEATAFFEGRKSADEAAKQLQNRATIYLNE